MRPLRPNVIGIELPQVSDSVPLELAFRGKHTAIRMPRKEIGGERLAGLRLLSGQLDRQLPQRIVSHPLQFAFRQLGMLHHVRMSLAASAANSPSTSML